MWCGEGQGWDWGYCYCYRVGPEVHAATLLCVYPIVLEVQQPDQPPTYTGNGEHHSKNEKV